MPHLVAIGACYIDTILSVAHFPGEDEKLRATNITRRRGGNCPNTLEVLAQLIKCQNAFRSPDEIIDSSQFMLSLVAVLPNESSPATQEIKASLPGVNLRAVVHREEEKEAASSFIIRSSDTGSRTIVNWNGLAEMTLDEFVAQETTLKNGDWWHFEGRIPETTLACIRHLRAVRDDKVMISVEVEKPGREGLQEMAQEADIVFYSKTWTVHQGHSSSAALLKSQAPLMRKGAWLISTWGEDGATAQAGGEAAGIQHHVPAYKRKGSTVVDTVGAGDTFIAGFLFASMMDWSIQKRLEFAARLAGLKVLQEGFSNLGQLMLEDPDD